MKSILLKLAHWINNKYGTIEIEAFDIIKYNHREYGINKLHQSQQIGCIDTLEIRAFGFEKCNLNK
ncbi:hypothetical protein LGL08_20050 [Clostridium estertheticum]|uniref:hypothetical protein n=1 Tax=Clostridium estertheticum TaxID=238834 RepID=UPI001CF34719|nr:hypothetical protein [Clostridium estertheticum]MCB2308998.1 hypothetical protein [Clostridium estertheticum]MCB2346868.1 hypothetical protein [Clostridium estertheticum]MCB2351820.1 hypothetical protein [Clostridium estertheticum]WAG48424.1 hypothetical protein LL127_22855 [Clostridium estertheticum]